jgi:hypothetical protein
MLRPQRITRSQRLMDLPLDLDLLPPLQEHIEDFWTQ